MSAAVLTLVAPRGARWRAGAFLFACVVSHGLLDACTNGGRGVAIFSPFDKRRLFFPWRPIEVSPIGHLDISVLVSELRWVWLPFLSLAVGLAAARRRLPARKRNMARRLH
jgi:inner membrane protein